MSGIDEQDPEKQDRALDAAEYVLGVLDSVEAASAARRMTDEPAFATDVSDWEGKLMPLTALVSPVEPPAELWDRILRSIDAPDLSGSATTAELRVAANDNYRGFWRTSTLGLSAIAAALVAFIALRPEIAPLTAPTAPEVAVLLPARGGTPAIVAIAEPSGRYLVRPAAGITVAPDRDLELWAMKAGAPRPESLGVIPTTGHEIAAGLPVGTQLLVSLEPKGGSPTGQPTGPVLYAGTLTRYE
jgi:anti-sigma-K factor RskA